MSDDFMARLERILEADTIDLRRLAEIGGGDPASFYVGTNLDGIDVRGQNLEGMKLTGLTPARVRKDEDTQLPAPAPLEPVVEMIVLLAVDNAGPRFVPDRDPWIRFFTQNEEEAFFRAADGFHGAVIVVAPRDRMTRAFPVGQRLNLMGRESICVAAHPLPIASRHLILASEAGPFRLVIGVQSSVFHTGAVSADMRMLLKLLLRSRHWESVRHMAPDPVSYFARVAIRRSTRPLDAAAAIFDKAAALGLSTHDCLLFAPHKGAWGRGDNDWPVLIRARHVTSTLDDRALAALLPQPRSVTILDDYASGLAEMLSRSGWVDVRTTHGESREGQVEVILPLEPHEIRLPVVDALSVKAPRARLEREQFGKAHFTDVDRIILSPDVDARTVAYGIVDQRVLTLSGRDLLACTDRPATLWSLIGAQFVRMYEEGSATELSLYIRLLLASAFNRGAVHHGHADMLWAVVEGYTLPPELRIVHVERAGNEVRAILAAIDPRGPQSQSPGAIVHLLIDRDGVAISDDPILRANDQRAPLDNEFPRLL